jgi:hypothetical protein
MTQVEICWFTFAGETLVFRAAGVSRYAPLSDHKTGVLGVLSVTNFRLSFPSAAACQEDAAVSAPKSRGLFSSCVVIMITCGSFHSSLQGITNKLLKPNDVCLADIDDVVSVTEDGRRRRLSFPLPDHSKVDVLEVHCKVRVSLQTSFFVSFCPLFFGR